MSYRSMFDLSGKTAVVTGALGILGRRYCEGLAEFGACVTAVDLDQRACAAFAAELQQQFHTDCIGIACDVSRPRQVTKLFDEVIGHYDHVDIVLNNAASKSDKLRDFYAPTEQYTMKEWRKIMSVNLDGMFLVAREAGKRMANQRTGGSIVQSSSIYGWVAPDPRLYEKASYLGHAMNTPAVYSASKAAIHGLTRHLAAQWAESGIRVNTLVPGGIEHEQNETFKMNYAHRTPMRRMGKAEEMVGAALFLASDASNYMTGQAIIVDGGFSVW